MKRPGLHRLAAILKDKSGASIAEGLVSIFLFSALMTTVAMMISLAIRINAIANTDAHDRQIEANAALRGTSAVAGMLEPHPNRTVRFTIIGPGGVTSDIDVDVTVFVTENWGYTAFEP